MGNTFLILFLHYDVPEYPNTRWPPDAILKISFLLFITECFVKCLNRGFLLLAYLLSLWYITIFFLPTGYLYDTLLPSTGPLSISMVHYHLLLAHWLSLLCTTIFYWPTGPLYANLQFSIGQLASPGPVAPSYVTLPFSNGPLVVSMVHYIFYWPTGYLYGAQPSSTDPLILPRVLYYFLLAHWLSL